MADNPSSDAQALVAELKEVRFGRSNIPGWEIGTPTDPGVLLIQEWWGVTDIVKCQANLISKRGYRVLIPDLYTHTELYNQKGTTVASNREEAGHSMNNLDFELATEEMGQAAAYLKRTGSPCVAITGGCMGGALAFAAAQKVPELVAAAPFYGTTAPLAGHLKARDGSPLYAEERIKIPVQYHTGALDNIVGFSDPATGAQVVKRMRDAGCDVEFYVYENTPHSFLNALVPGGVQFLEMWDYGVPPHGKVQLAFERLIGFLSKHCKRRDTSG